jgi:clan AA aspartic protease (TIGR02281 family)
LPEQAGSVPFLRVIRYCSGVSWACHSASVFLIFSVMSVAVNVVIVFIIRRTLRAGLLTAAIAALGCGPAKPVLLYVPPSVTIDSTRSAARIAKIVSPSRSFWEAMSNLDTSYVRRHSGTESESAFASALGLMMSGEHEDATLALDDLRATSPDTLIRAASRVLMTAMLQYQEKWKLLAELDSMGRLGTFVGSGSDRAGVELWSAAFRKVPPKEISFPSGAAVLPLLLSPSGTPMIRVTINGKQRVFWVDTGATMSIVSSAVAEECGMKPLLPDTLEVVTTTGRVPAQASSIASLALGGIRISNLTALIVSSERMQIRGGDASGLSVVVPIDGVVGYDIISRLDVRIDYVNGRMTLARPATNPGISPDRRNLFWVGTPIVRLVTSKGVPLHFNLDTGAQETYSTVTLPLKTKARVFAGERRLIGGLAGVTIVRGRFVDELRATMAGQSLVLRKLLVFTPAVNPFVTLDGILGSDVGRGGVVRIDATNGVFAFSSR